MAIYLVGDRPIGSGVLLGTPLQIGQSCSYSLSTPVHIGQFFVNLVTALIAQTLVIAAIGRFGLGLRIP